MTYLERKIIRRAAEIVAMTDITCLMATADASDEHRSFWCYTKLRDRFRSFYDAYGCPFADWRGDPEELRTIRVLLLETFLYHDGELG
jgi:hypothetical protein